MWEEGEEKPCFRLPALATLQPFLAPPSSEPSPRPWTHCTSHWFLFSRFELAGGHVSRRVPTHPPTHRPEKQQRDGFGPRLLWTGTLSKGKDQAAPPPLFIPGPYLIKQLLYFQGGCLGRQALLDPRFLAKRETQLMSDILNISITSPTQKHPLVPVQTVSVFFALSFGTLCHFLCSEALGPVGSSPPSLLS